MADNKDNLIALKSEFVMTDEGRALIVSQEGGVKFALYGFMIAQGLNAESLSDYRKLTMEDLLNSKEYADQTFILKNLKYNITATNTLEPESIDSYNEAMNDLKGHLFPLYYVPTNELKVVKKSDTEGSSEVEIEDEQVYNYGTYQFNFDPTMVKADFSNLKSNLHFNTLVLIGKQYVSTNDAVYNVDERQDYSIMGLVRIGSKVDSTNNSIVEGGIEILANQNKYLTFQTQLRITIKEDENVLDDSYSIELDDEIKNSGATKYIHLINNGLKNLEGGIRVGQDKEVLDEMNIGEGAVAFSKSLMVADCPDATEAENQFNAVGNIHSVNKTGTDATGKEIQSRPQYVLSTVKVGESVDEMEVYTAAIEMYGERTVDGNTETALFDIDLKPATDTIAVEIIGSDNHYFESSDRNLFSNGNTFTETDINNPSKLINSDSNILNQYQTKDNELYSAKSNTFENADNNKVFDASNNEFNTNKDDHVFATTNSKFNQSFSNIIFGCDGLKLNLSAGWNQFYGSKNIDAVKSYSNYGFAAKNVKLDNSHNNIIANSSNTDSVNSAIGFEESSNNQVIGGNDDIIYKSNYNLLYNTTNSKLYNSSNNLFFDDDYVQSNAASGNACFDNMTIVLSGACNNAMIKNHGVQLYSNSQAYSDNKESYFNCTTTAQADENPHIHNTASLQNLLLMNRALTITDAKDNVIIKSVTDSSSAIARIKGTTIIASDNCNLYNARALSVIQSPHTYVNVSMPNQMDDKKCGLHGINTNYGIYDNEAYYMQLCAETLDDTKSPLITMRMNSGVFNSYGSALNLARFVGDKTSDGGDYWNTMKYGIRPHNSNILGGNHNLFTGGLNVQFLGAEYCRNNQQGKSNQIIMGRLNNAGEKWAWYLKGSDSDIDLDKDAWEADIIFGNGYLPSEVTINKTKYSKDQLRYLDTTKDTIENVRNQAILMNALEFNASHGRLRLKETSREVKNNKQIKIDPNSIQFIDSEGNVTNEIGHVGQLECTLNLYVDYFSTKSNFGIYGYDTDSPMLKQSIDGWFKFDSEQDCVDTFKLFFGVSKIEIDDLETNKYYDIEECNSAFNYAIYKNFFRKTDNIISFNVEETDKLNTAIYANNRHVNINVIITNMPSVKVTNTDNIEAQKPRSHQMVYTEQPYGFIIVPRMIPYFRIGNSIRTFGLKPLQLNFTVRDAHGTSVGGYGKKWPSNECNLNENYWLDASHDFWQTHGYTPGTSDDNSTVMKYQIRRNFVMFATFADRMLNSENGGYYKASDVSSTTTMLGSHNYGCYQESVPDADKSGKGKMYDQSWHAMKAFRILWNCATNGTKHCTSYAYTVDKHYLGSGYNFDKSYSGWCADNDSCLEHIQYKKS